MIKTYYRLTKPGIIYGNALVAAAAFIFGSHQTIDWTLFAYMLAGLSLIVGSACVFNNIADRALDARMARTASRALAAGHISVQQATIFGCVLFILAVLLLWQVNILTFAAGVVGFVVYVFLYTPLKPRSGLAVYVGAFAGAMPPVVGYMAATNTLDFTVLLLFSFLYLWQLPHFFAISRYRFAEYHAAGIPLLVREPKNEAERRLARKIFYASLVVLLFFCLILILQR